MIGAARDPSKKLKHDLQTIPLKPFKSFIFIPIISVDGHYPANPPPPES